MDGKNPERPIVEAWLQRIEKAMEKKKAEYGQYADECSKFYDGPPDHMWQDEKAAAKERGWLAQGASLPNFRIMLNKPFEAVSRFGPTLFSQYPHVLVKPVARPEVSPEALGLDLNDPYALEQFQMLQMQKGLDLSIRQTHANIGSQYLNAVQRIVDKKTDSRDGISDCIVRGLGLTYTRIYRPRGTSVGYPRSERINDADFVKDSDATRREDVQWMAVRTTAPKNIVAERFGLHEDDLKGHFQSHEAQSTKRGRREAKAGKDPQDAKSYDLVEYWEIYSKNGFGDKLSAFSDKDKGVVGDYSVFGPYCYLAVARGIPFPLNLPPQAHQEDAEQLFERVSWPIPYWVPPLCDWPVNELGFYWKAGCTWPISPMKPLIGPIRFVNWCLSFLADKCAAAGTDYVAATKAAAEAIKDQLETGVGPYKLLELPSDIVAAAGGIDKMVSVLQSPNFNQALWQMVAEMMGVIDRLSGLNELLAGMSNTQMRSAEEASIKQANTQIIPDDMSQRVEDWLTMAAKKEIFAAHWVLNREDVEPIVGPESAYIWEQQMATQDIEQIISDFEYTIEAGSARKPNIANRQRAISEFMQSNGAMLQEMAMGGMPGPFNAIMTAWGDVNQMDVSRFIIPEPDPNQPQPPSEEEIKAQMSQAELAMKQQSHLLEMQQSDEKHEQEMEQDREKGKLDVQLARQKGRAALARAGSKQ